MDGWPKNAATRPDAAWRINGSRIRAETKQEYETLPDLKIAIALTSLKLPFKQALQTAARLGATGVEIDARNLLKPSEISETGRRQLKKTMTDLNLRVAALRFPTRRGYDVLQDLDRRLEATKEAMSFAFSLGASVVINSIGFIPKDTAHPGYVQLQASLSDLARYGQHIGAMLACETGSEPVDRLIDLLDGLPEQAIGVAFNPGNLIVNDCFEEGSIRKCAAKTLAVIARDGVRDLARGRGMDVPLGQGSAEFPEILGVLEEQHYRGWFHLDRLQSADPVGELAHAVSYLKAI